MMSRLRGKETVDHYHAMSLATTIKNGRSLQDIAQGIRQIIFN